MAGIRSLLPKEVQLIAGPGCPVCICPEEDIFETIQWALRGDAIVVAFGDMLRVPANASRGEARSLEDARAAGAHVAAVASPRDAVKIATEHPNRPIIFHAVGFETTLAPIAAMIAEGLPPNLYILMSGRLTWPAVADLLQSPDSNLDALIAPGHVATVMGAEEWTFVPKRFGVPAAIAGFTPESLLEAVYSVLSQIANEAPGIVNCYRVAVTPDGNPIARRLIGEHFDVVDANWRGIGVIRNSGFVLKDRHAAHDARTHFARSASDKRRGIAKMPPGCDCARVVLGKITPVECRLYGSHCTPHAPVGPCMVSDEGACRIWWTSGVREARRETANSQIVPSRIEIRRE